MSAQFYFEERRSVADSLTLGNRGQRTRYNDRAARSWRDFAIDGLLREVLYSGADF